MLSEFELPEYPPRSDVAVRSGALGALGAVRSIVIVVVALLADDGRALACESVTALAASRGIRVPSSQFVMVIVKFEPELALGEKAHCKAVPALEKSSAVKPDIFCEKTSEYEIDVTLVGEV
jgi:hypothetical protein